MAQVVAHIIGNDEVTGSSPVNSSLKGREVLKSTSFFVRFGIVIFVKMKCSYLTTVG